MQLLTGIAAGLAGALAMDLFSAAVSRGGTSREARDATPGGSRLGHGVQPAQAERKASEDATVRAGSAAYELATGERPDHDTRQWLGRAAHYAFGAAAGAMYGMARGRVPGISAGFGTVYGAIVWVVADEGVIPALGLSRKTSELGPGVHAYALAGHFVFGATLEATLRATRGSSEEYGRAAS